MRTALTLAVCLIGTPALAQFKCTQPGGAVSYQQAPCPPQAKAERVVLPPAAPDDDRGSFRAAAAVGTIRVGMNRAEVDTAMGGAPDKINRSAVAGRVHDQLVYRMGTGPAFLYMEDGRLTSWQLTLKENTP